MTVHRKTLIDGLQATLNLSSSQADFFIRDFFDIISEELANGNEVKISGFGNFLLRDKKARPGRNVTTNEVIIVQPRRVVSFRAGVKAKGKIKESTPALQKHFGLV